MPQKRVKNRKKNIKIKGISKMSFLMTGIFPNEEAKINAYLEWRKVNGKLDFMEQELKVYKIWKENFSNV